MSRDRISAKIWGKIVSNPKIKAKYRNEQSIRNAISDTHKKNHGITMNGAAYEFSKNYVSVYRYLDDRDKQNLQHLKSSDTRTGEVKNQRKQRIKNNGATMSFGQKYIKEANENASIYQYAYVLENSLRNLILEKFKDEKDWWNNRNFVKDEVRDYAKKIQEAEKKHKWLGKGRGDHPIYYVGLDHLLNIIERNFNPHFKDIFDLGNLRTWINESVPIRNLLAHNIRTQKEERDNIKIRAKYICNLIEKDLIQ